MSDQHHAAASNHGQPEKPLDLAHWLLTGELRPLRQHRDGTAASGTEGNAGLYRQAARYIRRPARRRNPWLLPLAISLLAGIVLSTGIEAVTGTLWGMLAYLPWVGCFTGHCLWMMDN